MKKERFVTNSLLFWRIFFFLPENEKNPKKNRHKSSLLPKIWKGAWDFLLSYFKYCQFWLYILMDNRHLSNITNLKQGVCHTVALLFTLKSILRQEWKNYGKSNISWCKNIIFKTSSKIKKPKSFKILYNSRTNLKFQHKPKYHLSKNPHIKIDLLLLPSRDQNPSKLLYSIMNLKQTDWFSEPRVACSRMNLTHWRAGILWKGKSRPLLEELKLLEYGMDSSTQPRISIQLGFKVNKAVFVSLDDDDDDDSLV